MDRISGLGALDALLDDLATLFQNERQAANLSRLPVVGTVIAATPLLPCELDPLQ